MLKQHGIEAIHANKHVGENLQDHIICKKYAGTNHHPCGAYSMMSEDLGGAVNDRLKVYRVAVAEKAADLICENCLGEG